jgi:hypothetical protein
MNDYMNVIPNTNMFGNDPLNIIGKTFPCRLYSFGRGYNELGKVLGTYKNLEDAYTVALEGGDVIVLDKVNIVGFGYKP